MSHSVDVITCSKFHDETVDKWTARKARNVGHLLLLKSHNMMINLDGKIMMRLVY
jgi:hypothetical protein